MLGLNSLEFPTLSKNHGSGFGKVPRKELFPKPSSFHEGERVFLFELRGFSSDVSSPPPGKREGLGTELVLLKLHRVLAIQNAS